MQPELNAKEKGMRQAKKRETDSSGQATLGVNPVSPDGLEPAAGKTFQKKGNGKVVVSWTGGKDGCFACYHAILAGFVVSHLVNFRDARRSRSHEINLNLLYAQSRALGIPLVHTDSGSYEEEFKKVIRTLNAGGAGIAGAVFGHIETHKSLVERICSELNITLLLPLWKRDSWQLMSEFIDAGFEAIVVSARADLFGEEWLGRRTDRDFLRDLWRFNPTIDPCGEYGEFHTFVLDGPLFNDRIRILEHGKRVKNGYWFMDILDYALERKADRA